ncbi:albusnodin/ikarugamycin family macrolactam cyclase [Nocardiopsis sp. NPDC049922]|uniref:albusnodin/ikarugamycin family macrolactam cyclase n=1 Tax=Nocardiopsis sp. NPDC049922 TaxID=3155157 RepID=UPI0033C8AC5F
MRWAAGYHRPRPSELTPIGADTLTDHHSPVWTIGALHHRTTHFTVTVIGGCGATTAQLHDTCHDALRTRDWHQLTHWPGSYLSVLTTPEETVVVTDLAGVWPVFYTHHDNGWLWATRARPLAQATAARLDTDVLAARLAAPLVEELRSTRSLWRGIHQVPPGHALILTHQRATTIDYEPPTGPDPDATPHRLRTALSTAVHLRATTTERLSADLSGGLDSTTLTLLAARRRSVYALTYTAPGLDNHEDVRHARTAAATTSRITHHLVHGDPDTLPYSHLEQAAPTDAPAPDLRALGRHRAYLSPARAHGSTLHLTGNGGDTVLSTGPAYLADLAATGQHRRVWAETRARARLWRLPAHQLLRGVYRLARTRYPHALDQLATHLEQGTRPPRLERALAWTAPTALAAWLTPTSRRVLAEHAHHAARTADDDHLPGAWADWRGLRYYAATHTTFIDLIAHDVGVHISAPFLDNQVVRATLAAPSWTRGHVHRFKPQLHAALADLLPPALLKRRTKDSFTTHAYEGLRRHAPAIRTLLEDAHLADVGIVDPAPALAALNRAVDGRAAPLSALAHLVTAELWVRTLAEAPAWWTTTPTPTGSREVYR